LCRIASHHTPSHRRHGVGMTHSLTTPVVEPPKVEPVTKIERKCPFGPRARHRARQLLRILLTTAQHPRSKRQAPRTRRPPSPMSPWARRPDLRLLAIPQTTSIRKYARCRHTRVAMPVDMFDDVCDSICHEHPSRCYPQDLASWLAPHAALFDLITRTIADRLRNHNPFTTEPNPFEASFGKFIPIAMLSHRIQHRASDPVAPMKTCAHFDLRQPVFRDARQDGPTPGRQHHIAKPITRHYTRLAVVTCRTSESCYAQRTHRTDRLFQRVLQRFPNTQRIFP